MLSNVNLQKRPTYPIEHSAGKINRINQTSYFRTAENDPKVLIGHLKMNCLDWFQLKVCSFCLIRHVGKNVATCKYL